MNDKLLINATARGNIFHSFLFNSMWIYSIKYFPIQILSYVYHPVYQTAEQKSCSSWSDAGEGHGTTHVAGSYTLQKNVLNKPQIHDKTMLNPLKCDY